MNFEDRPNKVLHRALANVAIFVSLIISFA
jgi:hypothetical protein